MVYARHQYVAEGKPMNHVLKHILHELLKTEDDQPLHKDVNIPYIPGTQHEYVLGVAGSQGSGAYTIHVKDKVTRLLCFTIRNSNDNLVLGAVTKRDSDICMYRHLSRLCEYHFTERG